MRSRLGARQLLELLADPGTRISLDHDVDLSLWDAAYREELRQAALHSGCDEAVLTAEIRLRGHRAVVIASEFTFLGGSLGAAAARRIVAALQYATLHRLPVIALPCSGGTRMQEGTPAFLHMLEVADAVRQHRSAGLPYLVHLRHPTMGGALASWGSLGQLTSAAPGALIGFLGPRVTEALNGAPFPEDVQTAENLQRRGIVDVLVPDEDLRSHLAELLGVLGDTTAPAPERGAMVSAPEEPGTPLSAWEAVQLTRAADRPGVQDLLRRAYWSMRLSGTGAGERDDSVLVALCHLDGTTCVLVGHDRSVLHATRPAGLRASQRGMRLAEELGLPLITVVDTVGAELSAEAENGALAGEIARSVGLLRSLTVPVATVLLGQGCGGAALALFSGRYTIAAEHAWMSPLPLEGASMIVHRDIGHAAQLAHEQRITAQELFHSGAVQRIAAEGPAAGFLLDSVQAEVRDFFSRSSAFTR
ncbi:carboxyl transferase domain-containing protein [Arthrobacter sp. RAF14]|uniref:carboxyl transferase domain-containing protein n=1 Tax=Arthrobacter sp. RAF14 TaxID=3233051 RepID=UPI003F8E7B9E